MRTVALLSFTRAIRRINKFALPTLAGFSLSSRGHAYLPIGYRFYKSYILRNFHGTRRKFIILKKGFDREFEPLSGALIGIYKS